jgi:formamidopyrimidine-DNA glycosylase
MPELPEVETVRRGLEERVVGKRLVAVEVTGRRSVRRQPPAELVQRLTGRRVDAVRRKGKFLALELDDGAVLVIHLRMTGRLLWVAGAACAAGAAGAAGTGAAPTRAEALGEDALAPEATAKHTHVVARLGDGSELHFVDPRTFGEWFVTDDVGPDGMPVDFGRFGPDPLVDGLPTRVLRDRLAGHKVPLKAALTDQRVVSGIGSIYADEICFAAGVRPDRPTDTLAAAEVTRLARSARKLLATAVELRGSSLRDERYRDLMGDLGSYQSRHNVYDRLGKACRRCGTEISRVRFGARVAYCCEGCQH